MAYLSYSEYVICSYFHFKFHLNWWQYLGKIWNKSQHMKCKSLTNDSYYVIFIIIYLLMDIF